MTASPRHYAEEFASLNTRCLSRLRDDQLMRDRVRDRWYGEMNIVADCIRTLLKRSKHNYGGHDLKKEMTNLLSEVLYLFDDSFADLTEIFEFRNDMVMDMMIEMDRCVMDLREVAEAALNHQYDGEKRLEKLESDNIRFRDEIRDKDIIIESEISNHNDEIRNIDSIMKRIQNENIDLRNENKRLVIDSTNLGRKLKNFEAQEDYVNNLEIKYEQIQKENAKLSHDKEGLERENVDLFRLKRNLESENQHLIKETSTFKEKAGEFENKLRSVIFSNVR